jgi:hypothetical protein
MRGKVTALLMFHQTKPYNDAEAAPEKLPIARARGGGPKHAMAALLVSRNTVGVENVGLRES